MSEENVDITDDQNKFEDEFFQRTPEAKPEPEEVEEEVEAEVEEEVETETEVDDLGEDENDPPAPEGEESEEEEVEETPKPKKKNSAQERINELTADKREAQRERDALRREFEALKAAVEKETKEAPKGLREQLPADAPHPDATGEDGNPLYELGEFDPKFIRDLTKFTIAEETKAAKAEAAKEAQTQAIEASRQELVTAWGVKLEKAEETLPDIREEIKGMTEVFADIEPVYGEYLASTVMSCEFGPEIMYYLSQNIGEARKIVASGPAAATLAIGRLEAKFVSPAKQEEKSDAKIVSKAPIPPEGKTKGQGGRFAIRGDTDNQDAFEKEFFKTR